MYREFESRFTFPLSNLILPFLISDPVNGVFNLTH